MTFSFIVARSFKAHCVCLFVSASLLGAASSTPLIGQTPTNSIQRVLPVDLANVVAGSRDEENVLLRELLDCTRTPTHAVRPFSVTALRDMLSSSNGNCRQIDSAFTRLVATGWSFGSPFVGSVYNTSTNSDNAGIVWTGRGLTLFASAGVIARYGRLSIAFRPVGFWSENRSFTPQIDTTDGFRNPISPTAIDLPWRFGDKSYGRVDLGESWVQFDAPAVSAGFSTATQQWGPMHEYPLLLGPNAGGFPHLFAGSGIPWNVGIGRLSARMSVGRLDQSAYAPVHEGSTRRLGAGLVASFVPSIFPNLEIGGGRFYHRRWPEDGVDFSIITLPFESFFKTLEEGSVDIPDNQLASIFSRIAIPQRHVEFYGEFLRDDYNRDARDLATEPDHESAFALGVRKAWLNRSQRAVMVLTMESVNARLTHLVRVRGETPMYVHTDLPEGHTERGKLLGSPAAFGGSGLVLRIDRYDASGAWKAALRSERTAQNEEGGQWNGQRIGFNGIELARIVRQSNVEYTVGAAARFNWSSAQGANNLSIRFGVRY